MERRRKLRRARRVAVRFTEPGSDRTRSGFTTDISLTGMFIGTNHVLSPGSRIRIEVADVEHGFVLEGIVARALRRNPKMGQIQPSGMGVRFFQVTELIERLFPQAASEFQADERIPGGGDEGPRSETRKGRTERTGSGDGGAASRPRRGFLVRFRSSADLERTWNRDVAQGGLFVSAREPAPVDEVIILEIRPPEDAPRGSKVRLQARVVQNFDRGSESDPNLLSGMGVEFLEPDRALSSLSTLLGS